MFGVWVIFLSMLPPLNSYPVDIIARMRIVYSLIGFFGILLFGGFGYCMSREHRVSKKKVRKYDRKRYAALMEKYIPVLSFIIGLLIIYLIIILKYKEWVI
jgi:hypothetical protein